jgi:hypothetical protein
VTKELKGKLKETLTAVLPVSGIILLLHFTVAPMPSGILALFLSSVVFLILGMTLFTLGADSGMTPMGNQMGAALVKLRNLPLFIVTALLLGIMITIAEPDLQVLGNQMPKATLFTLGEMEVSVGSALIYAVALGVGLFLVVSVLRILFKISLSFLLIGFYILTFLLAAFTGKEFLAVAFDSGGVTTGPITVPFILALGVGIASVRGGDSARDDSFGLVGLCSLGPILVVTIMGMLVPGGATYTSEPIPEIGSFSELMGVYLDALPHFAWEVALALSPIFAFYLIFQIFFLKLPSHVMQRTLIGGVITYLGLVVFLTAVNVGFMPVGSYIGGMISSLDYNWVLIPIGMVVGFFIVAAEPAVHVLNEQVEDVTGGAISRKAMMVAMMIGMSVSVGLAMIRVLTGISIWYLIIPGYALALGLTFFVPKIFTAIAFDSGGVASGPMTATFLLPFAVGACEAAGGNILMDAFGVVAMVAMTPLVTIQILGAIYAVKEKQAERAEISTAETPAELEEKEEEIIDF